MKMNWAPLASCLLLVLASCSPVPFAELPTQSLQNVSLQGLEDGPGDAAEAELATRIDRTLLSASQKRMLSSRQNAAWQIMHGAICYGDQLKLATPNRGQTTALEYAFSGGLIRGFELQPGDSNLPSYSRQGLRARLEPGSYSGQGHVDQWIAIFAMAGIPLETEIQLGERVFTIEDWARQAQYDVPDNILDEYSWTLIALTHYFPDTPTWLAKDNYEVGWEMLVEQELQNDIDFSPCGGTHRLAGIVSALRAKDRLGLPDNAVWLEARKLLDDLIQQTKETRGSDGRLSSLYFGGAGKTADLTAELASSGHLFEFLALASSDEQIREPWMAQAAERLCGLLEQLEAFDLDCGALYHALHGLKLYRQRAFE